MSTKEFSAKAFTSAAKAAQFSTGYRRPKGLLHPGSAGRCESSPAGETPWHRTAGPNPVRANGLKQILPTTRPAGNGGF